MQQDGMEAALVAAEEAIAEAQRDAAAATRELKRARAAAATGQVRDLRRSLAAAADAAQALAKSADAAQQAYDLDETAHLSSGGYARELLAAAAAAGVVMVEEDDRLLCYPSVVRVVPADAALEVDRKRDRRLRPSVVVRTLAAARDRPPKGKPVALLESLLTAYQLLAGRQPRPDPVLRLDALWSVLTLLPGTGREYGKAEFARDLYQLDRSGPHTTRSGRTLRFHASTGTRGAGVLTTVAETGQQQRYWGVSFTAPDAGSDG